MNFDKNTSKRIEDIVQCDSVEHIQYEQCEKLKHVCRVMKRNDYEELSESEALRIASTLQIESAKIRAMYKLNDMDLLERIAFDVKIQTVGG